MNHGGGRRPMRVWGGFTARQSRTRRGIKGKEKSVLRYGGGDALRRTSWTLVKSRPWSNPLVKSTGQPLDS